MNETLTRLLHDRAEEVRFDPIDLEAVAGAGAHAVRRRRWWGAAGVAAAVVALASLAAVPWSHDPQPPAAAPAPVPTTGVTWASGTVLHTPSGDVELGHAVASFVRTSLGYVFTDGHDVYSYAGGEVRDAGPLRNHPPLVGWPRMVGDPDGTLAAWPDGADFMVLDQRTGNVRRVYSKPYANLLGVDGGRLYAANADDAFTIDVDSGDVDPIRYPNRQDLSVVAVQGLALLAVDGEGRLVSRGPDGIDVLISSAAPDAVSLSPDGGWAVAGYSQASGPVRTFDLRTGAQTELPLDAFTAYPYEWLDADTLALLSLPTPGGHYQLVTCRLRASSCDVAVPDLGEGRDDGGNGVRFVLPIGQPYFPYPHG